MRNGHKIIYLGPPTDQVSTYAGLMSHDTNTAEADLASDIKINGIELYNCPYDVICDHFITQICGKYSTTHFICFISTSQLYGKRETDQSRTYFTNKNPCLFGLLYLAMFVSPQICYHIPSSSLGLPSKADGLR